MIFDKTKNPLCLKTLYLLSNCPSLIEKETAINAKMIYQQNMIVENKCWKLYPTKVDSYAGTAANTKIEK